MDKSTLETISIIALVVALIVFMALVARWVVKRWFAGSWADRIIGGMRDEFEMEYSDVAAFGDRCKALQDAIINGTPITYETMVPILNTIYLAFRAGGRLYMDITRGWYQLESHLDLCRIVTDGLKAAPLAALILMACPYMFRWNIRALWEHESFYQMLLDKAKNKNALRTIRIKGNAEEARKILMNRYFNPIYDSIRDNVSGRVDYDFIREKWSDKSATLMTVAMMLTVHLADNKVGFTAEKAGNALKEIVIPDVYELLITNGASMPLNIPPVRLTSLPASGDPRFKG